MLHVKTTRSTWPKRRHTINCINLVRSSYKLLNGKIFFNQSGQLSTVLFSRREPPGSCRWNQKGNHLTILHNMEYFLWGWEQTQITQAHTDFTQGHSNRPNHLHQATTTTTKTQTTTSGHSQARRSNQAHERTIRRKHTSAGTPDRRRSSVARNSTRNARNARNSTGNARIVEMLEN